MSCSGASPPPPLRAGWQPREIVFAARGPGPFTMAYGSHVPTAGALPIATMVPGYDSTGVQPVNASIARAGTAPISLGGPDRLRKPPDVHRWLLWAALVLGAAVLGWMAWRLSRELAVAESADPKLPDAPDSRTS